MRVKKMCRVLRGVLFFAVLFAGPYLYGDNHIITERSFCFTGNAKYRFPGEIWIGDNKSCSIGKNRIIVYRHDLKKKWTLNLKKKKYVEEPLQAPKTRVAAGKGNGEKKKVRMQDVGWHYEPVYDWMKPKIKENREMDGRKCRLIVVEGDADYAEIKHELWVTQDVALDINYYHKWHPHSLPAEVNRMLPPPKNYFILKTKKIIEHSISPTETHEFKVVKIKTAEPPPGVYDIPPGFQRVDSKEQLRRK